MLIILMWSLFKGFEPIRQSMLFMMSGFLFTILGAAARGILIILLDILIDVSYGNVFIMCALILSIAVFMMLFGRNILLIFGVNPNTVQRLKRNGYARGTNRYLRKAAREARKERKRKKKEGADEGNSSNKSDKQTLQEGEEGINKGDESEVQAERRRRGTERAANALRQAIQRRRNAQDILNNNADKETAKQMEGNKKMPNDKAQNTRRRGIVPKQDPYSKGPSIAERTRADSNEATGAEPKPNLGTRIGTKLGSMAENTRSLPSGIKRSIKERVSAAPTEAKYQVYRTRQQAIEMMNDTKTSVTNKIGDTKKTIKQNVGDFKDSFKDSIKETQGTNRVVREERSSAYRTRVETKQNYINEIERQDSVRMTEKVSVRQIESNRRSGTGEVLSHSKKTVSEKYERQEKPVANTNRYTGQKSSGNNRKTASSKQKTGNSKNHKKKKKR